jgi:hypothetical protein
MLAILLGFLQAWASRMSVSDDAVCYLDVGDYIWHGQWLRAVNGIWSPLYGAILGLVVEVFHPSLDWEYPLVHLILYLFFIFALGCFDFLLRELILLRRETESREEAAIADWVWLTIGYSVFLWSSLDLIGVTETNPDMLVAASFYLACALLVRLRRGVAGWPAYLGLGLTLGLGYLTKSIMFPVSVLCLGIAFLWGWKRGQIRQASGALLVFLVAATPFITALSLERGKLTFGETGRYNYAIHVNQLQPMHWQGGPAENGWPIHPTRQIVDRPATFEFAGPIGGTYPAWYDASYWYEGVQGHFNLPLAVKTVARLLRIEGLILFELQGSLIASLFVLFYVGARKWSVAKDLSTYSFLLLPALATLLLYALIYIEPRYLAPFLAVLLVGLFFSVHLPASAESRRLYSAVAIFIFAMFLYSSASTSLHLRGLARDVLGRSTVDPDSYQQVAKEMYRQGLRPGDRIASLQWSSFNAAQVARLDRVQIIAEVYYWPTHPDTIANDFWKADPAAQERVIQAIGRTGARVIISQMAPSPSGAAGWTRVGNTDYYSYWLASSAQGSVTK